MRISSTFFKKLTRLDVVFILMFLIIFASLIVGRLARRTQWVTIGMYVSNEEWWWGTTQPEYWLVDNIRDGMISKNTFGETVAEITDTQIFDQGENKKTALLEIRLKAFYDKKRRAYIYESRPVEVGSGLNLNFESQNIQGIVAYFGEAGYAQQPTAEVTVKIEKLDNDVLQRIEQPIEMKNSNGLVLAKVTDITSRQYTSYEFSDLRGARIETVNPDFSEVFLTIQLQAYQSGENLYFVDGTPLKLGGEIWFHFDSFFSGKTIITSLTIL